MSMIMRAISVFDTPASVYASLNSYICIEHQNDISGALNGERPDYTSVDIGITWQVTPNLELGL